MAVSPWVSAVADAVAGLVAVPPVEQPDDVVLDDVEELVRVRARLDAQIARGLAVLDAREVTTTQSGRSTRAWLVEQRCVERSLAGRKLRLARQLWRWPTTEQAWLAGDVSEDQVAVIFSALRLVPADVSELVEKTLLSVAGDSAPHLLADAVDVILIACGVENSSDEAAAKRYSRRGVTVATTFAGTGSLAGTLSPTLTDKLRRALELAQQPGAADDDRTRAQRFHDALEVIVDRYLDSAALPALDHGERPARIVVTIELAALQGSLVTAWGTLPSGARISPATARRLACDAEIIPAVLGGKGEVLDLGRASRSFSAAVRRAAILRDGDRCVFPKCQNARHECHHIEHWANGGSSSLDNAAWLCSYHHWLVHENSWALRRESDGGYTFTAPDGVRRQTSSTVRQPSFWDTGPPG